MSQKCRVCHHDQKLLIEDCSARLGAYTAIARVFALKKDAVRRHALHHLAADHQLTHTPYQIDQAVYGKEYAQQRERMQEMLQEWKCAEISTLQPRVTKPAKPKPRRPVCRCAAYGFPHRLNAGLCRFPEEPAEVWQGEIGKPSAANWQRRQSKRILHLLWRR
jgi:hypothetical protein